MQTRTMSVAEWAMLLALSVLWGGSFFFVGWALRDLPPLTIVFSRVLVAALVLFAFMILSGRRVPRSAGLWLAFGVMSVLNNLAPFSLIAWGQQQTGAALASILNATTPFFTVLVAHALTSDEGLTPAKLAGVALGFVGVAAMIGRDALAGGGAEALMAQAAILGAALSYAFAGVFGRRFRRMGVDPVTTAAGQVMASALLLAPVVLLVDQPWSLAAPQPSTWAALACLGIFSTALAYVLFFRILSGAGATNVMLVTLLVPVSAVALGVALLGEQLRAEHLFGVVLITVGLTVIDGRVFRLIGRLRPSRP
jgi:drug/metabolite transporter (DMT)-like permease